MAHNYLQNQKLVTKDKETQSNNVAQNLLDSLKGIQSNYQARMPKIDYGALQGMPQNNVTMPTNEQIWQEATKGLKEYKISGQTKIKADFEKNSANIQDKQNKLEKAYEEGVEAQKAKLNNDINKVNAKSILHGIKNSSINAQLKDNLQRQYDAGVATSQQEYLSKLNSLQLQKNVIEQQRDNALANFDIAYANKLNKQFNVLTNEYNAALKNAQEYQNILAQKRAEIEEDFNAQHGQTIKKLTQDMQKEMTLDAFVKLKDLPKSQAQQILNTTPQIREYLGDWYSALELWLNR
ncbi:MAG: hypothetical protein IJU58_02895 [Clostridia bacterium]|nr:hypothetical protein [Clostridia bacterium]